MLLQLDLASQTYTAYIQAWYYKQKQPQANKKYDKVGDKVNDPGSKENSVTN